MAGYIGSKASVINSGVENKKVITATAGQTSFTGLTYSPNRVHVFQNGVRLVDGTDYTATDGNSLTLTVGALADDQVVVVSYSGFTVGDVVPASTGGTFSNAVTIDADGSTVLTVDRATSDGTIIDVQKSGSSVGSIGTLSSGLNIGTGDTGLQFSAANDAIYPFDPSSNNIRGDFISLGDANGRFTDLYLSGGVFLGGTGSANKISDYETGTWTPVIRGSGGNPSVTYVTGNTGGMYTKVGDTVFVFFEVRWSAITGGGGIVYISGLPFTRSSTNTPDGDRSTFDFYNVTVPSGGISPICSAAKSQTNINITFSRSGTTTTTLPVSNLINTNPGFIRASLFYKV